MVVTVVGDKVVRMAAVNWKTRKMVVSKAIIVGRETMSSVAIGATDTGKFGCNPHI